MATQPTQTTTTEHPQTDTQRQSQQNSETQQNQQNPFEFVAAEVKKELEKAGADITRDVKEHPQDVAQAVKAVAEEPSKLNLFLNLIKDRVLSFLQDIVPKINFHEFSGKGDVDYSISNLDLTGIQIPKESTKVIIDGNQVLVDADKLACRMKNVKWAFKQNSFPNIDGGGIADLEIADVHLKMKLAIEGTVDRQDLRLASQGTGVSIPVLHLTTDSTVLNAALGLFETLLRKLSESQINSALNEKMAEFIQTTNESLKPYLPLLASLKAVVVPMIAGGGAAATAHESVRDHDQATNARASTQATVTLPPLQAKLAAQQAEAQGTRTQVRSTAESL